MSSYVVSVKSKQFYKALSEGNCDAAVNKESLQNLISLKSTACLDVGGSVSTDTEKTHHNRRELKLHGTGET